MGTFDQLKAVAEDVAAKLKTAAEEAGTAVGDLANTHGDKVSESVKKATDFVDEKTSGSLSSVTDTVDKVADQAVTAAKGLAETNGEAPEAPEATEK